MNLIFKIVVKKSQTTASKIIIRLKQLLSKFYKTEILQFLCSSLFCARNLLTRRPGSCVARGPRPAVEEGKQDGEDGSVGAVRDTRGSRVRCGSDRHGLGT